VYVFVNHRLVRDRLVLHALTEAYRNIIPPTSYPVVLLFLEMPPQEVDVNVHPAKTEVRFRQSGFVHDFIRDTVRTTLMTARPAASFAAAVSGSNGVGQASESLLIDVSPMPGPAGRDGVLAAGLRSRRVRRRWTMPIPSRCGRRWCRNRRGGWRSPSMASRWGMRARAGAALRLRRSRCGETLNALATLKPLGQLRDSFILAANDEGLWIIDQHVAHERVLFEKILREREVEQVQRQRLLMPVLVDLLPAQMVAFAAIARELELNGFEAEPFGPRTLAIKAAPVGLGGARAGADAGGGAGRPEKEQQAENAETRRRRIAASIACHAAIKVNMPLDAKKIDWLLAELGKTEHPTSCPHGRPIALRYSHKDIQRAFQRI
jgi:DNA mismatch repair protein MutL